jgi:hypothetical protein
VSRVSVDPERDLARFDDESLLLARMDMFGRGEAARSDGHVYLEEATFCLIGGLKEGHFLAGRGVLNRVARFCHLPTASLLQSSMLSTLTFRYHSRVDTVNTDF